MKILHVTQGYSPAIGGTEWLVQRVSEELVRQFGDEVTVFTTNCYNGEAFYTPRLPRMPAGWETINGVRVRRFPVLSRPSQWLRWPQMIANRLKLPGNQYLRAASGGPLIPGLRRAIEDQPADIVSAASFPLLHMFAALNGGHQSGRPVVLTGCLHPDDDWGFGRPMIYRAIQAADHYIALTQFEAEYVLARGAARERVAAIGTGVDLECFDQASPGAAKARLNLGEAPVVGFIGQMGQHKGLDTLLRAMPLVWQRLPLAQLVIAGARTLFSQYVERTVRDWPERFQRQTHVVYNFAENEKYELFKALDVLAYPSGYESFGIAFVEAWACGIPVIGCRRGAVPWVIDSGRDGLLVAFQNPPLLAEAINLLLANPQWARALGARGRLKTETRYNWPEIARRFRSVYVETMQRWGSHLPSQA
jgi:glycosyltransferase involved in cell wall biosynthesis